MILTNQPLYPARIDYAGLGKGVRILFNPAVGGVDLVTGNIWTPGGNASVATGEKGSNFSFDGVDDYYAYAGYPELTGNIGTFFIWCPVVGAADTYGHVLFGASSPSVSGYQIYPSLGVSIGSNSQSSGTLPSWFNTTNRSLVLASGGTAATCKAFLDGTDTGITWSNAPVAWGSGNKNFNLGRYAGGTSWNFNGTILIAGYTDEVWGEGEARAFHESYGLLIFEPEGEDIYLPSTGEISLAGVASNQGNSSEPAAIVQGHVLAGADSTQPNPSATGTITQAHALEVTASSQGNTGSSVAVTIDANIDLVGAASTQAGTSSAATISQASVLTVSAAAQANSSTAPAITQVQILAGTASTQGNLGGTGTINIASEVVSAPSTQANLAGTGQITRAQTLTGANSIQANLSSTGTISDGIVMESSLTSGIARTIRVKKPGIPAGTPEWLKTMIEILTGRRGNRIEAPKFQTLTFSATPTSAECEALYSYVNNVRAAVDQLISRMDG